MTAGAAALDAHVARRAAEAGLDLTFLRTIPGSIGGAVRMNAGCYGSYVADHLESRAGGDAGGGCGGDPGGGIAVALSAIDPARRVGDRGGDVPGAGGASLRRWRRGWRSRSPSAMRASPRRSVRRDRPFAIRWGGHPPGTADDTHELKAWKVIDDAGMRGARRGGAQMSEMHSNFLINAGGATAADLEGLGEEVRKRVFQASGITLEWEIMRIGETTAD